MNMFTPEQLEFFYSFPSWSVALWAIAVWGGLLGCYSLIAKKQISSKRVFSFFDMHGDQHYLYLCVYKWHGSNGRPFRISL